MAWIVFEVDNGSFSFTILPTRGMSIWRGQLNDMQVGWQSPITGPVHPNYVTVMEPSGLGWLKGFDELFVRCGLESNGAPQFDENGSLVYPVHGRIANLPAEYVAVEIDGDSGEIQVTGIVYETCFHFQKLRMTTTISTKVGERGFRVQDKIENLSASDAQTQMLYHINFGAPLMEPNSKIVAPVKTIVPRNDHAAANIHNWETYLPEQAGFAEQVYFFELNVDQQGNTQTMLKNSNSNQGVTLRFNKQQLPCFTLWKNQTSAKDGYVTGLEPGTNFPNPRNFESKHNRVIQLPPQGSIQYEVQMEVHPDAASVAVSEKEINKIQGDTNPIVYEQPQDDWCAP